MKNLPISPRQSFSNLEKLMIELIGDEPVKIRLPKSLENNGALGIEVAVIQMLGTWLRKNKHRKILHSYQKSSPDSFKSLCSSTYGIAALAMSDEIWDDEKNKLKRKDVLKHAIDTIEALRENRFKDAFKSRYLGVPYIKTPNYDRELEMLFYNNNEIIQSDAFSRKFEKIIEDKIAGFIQKRSLHETINIDELSILLWEILKNTHDHGRHTKSGDVLSNNFRSIIIQHRSVTHKYIKQWLGEDPSEMQLLFAENWNNTDFQTIPFLDISVIDFGEGFIGLAQNKFKTELNDDLELILRCCTAGWSRLFEPSRGQGLTKVLKAIQKNKGWLRIRTGKYLIEKTFVNNSDPAEITRDDIKEMDVDVCGTSFHVSFYLHGFVNEGVED